MVLLGADNLLRRPARTNRWAKALDWSKRRGTLGVSAMKRSEKRILTTHAGSLLRPRALGEMLGRHSRHEKVDAAAMEAAILAATRHVRQAAGRMRHRYRQQRRAGARELFHLRATSDERLRRRERSARLCRHDRVSEFPRNDHGADAQSSAGRFAACAQGDRRREVHSIARRSSANATTSRRSSPSSSRTLPRLS